MAGYFKKRRKNQGPNKNEEKVQRGVDAQSGGGTNLSSRFPTVKRLKITLQFFTAQQLLLDEKVLELGPTDSCRFDAACPGRCGTGRFDFTEAVSNAVQRRQPVAESGALCQMPLFAGSKETCGCQVKCRMELEFLPPPAEADPAAAA